MKGITILNTIPEHQIATPVNIFGIITISLLTVAIIISIVIDIHDQCSGLVFGVTLAIVVIPMFIGITCICETEVQPERYEVTINDDINFIEFTQSYRIVDQRGNIYVIEPKEVKHNA